MEIHLPLYGTLADVAHSVQAILMASHLRSLESLASAFSTALGKKVGVCDCLCSDMIGGNTSCECSMKCQNS